MQSRGTPSEGGRPRAAGVTKRHTALDLDGDDWYIRHRMTEHRWYACRGGEGDSIGVGVCLGVGMTYEQQYLSMSRRRGNLDGVGVQLVWEIFFECLEIYCGWGC